MSTIKNVRVNYFVSNEQKRWSSLDLAAGHEKDPWQERDRDICYQRTCAILTRDIDCNFSY